VGSTFNLGGGIITAVIDSGRAVPISPKARRWVSVATAKLSIANCAFAMKPSHGSKTESENATAYRSGNYHRPTISTTSAAGSEFPCVTGPVERRDLRTSTTFGLTCRF